MLYALLCVGLLCSFNANAITPTEREYQIKSAFIANFIRYTRWTPPPSKRFLFCTTNERVNNIISLALSDERWFDLPPKFTMVSPGQEKDCHFLFIDHASDTVWQTYLTSNSIDNLLIVSEKKGSARSLSQINFFLADNKLRFEINPSSLELSGLRVSASLLRLARIVKDKKLSKGAL